MTRPGAQCNGPSFAAIDFETADAKRDSACAIGIVVVRAQKVAVRYQSLIRPPRKTFSPFCVGVHGITWGMVCNERPFAEVWA